MKIPPYVCFLSSDPVLNFCAPCLVHRNLQVALRPLVELLFCFFSFHSLIKPEENVDVCSVLLDVRQLGPKNEDPCSIAQLMQASWSSLVVLFLSYWELSLEVLRSSHWLFVRPSN